MPAYLCTRDRLVRLRRDGADIVLEADRLQCVAAYDRTVLVGTLGGGVVLSRGEGRRGERTAGRGAAVPSAAAPAADGALYAGTEPSRLFVARDGGGWTELEAL